MPYFKVVKNPAATLQRLNKSEYIATSIIPRSVFIAIIIGSILNLVNQYDSVFGSKPFNVVFFTLLYFTPFFVVLISQHLSLLKALENSENGHAFNKHRNVFATAFFHSIPLKAFLVSLGVGSINLVVLSIQHSLSSDELWVISSNQVIQTYILPMVFGLLSQALSYNRAIKEFAK